MGRSALFVSCAVIFAAGLLAPVSAYGEKCGMRAGRPGKGNAKTDIECNALMRARMLVERKNELGLSGDQIGKVKDLKLKLEKNLIMKNAEADIIELDIKAGMRKGAMDTAAMNTLIDKKYELEKEKAKDLVAFCAALKGILTEGQKETLKGVCEQGSPKSMNKGSGGMVRMGKGSRGGKRW